VFDSPKDAVVQARASRNALHTGPVAQRVVPLPRALADDARWSGWFSAPGRLPRGKWVRVVFGRFTFPGRAPRGFVARFACVTMDARRL
jgi:hypothetical protein